MDQIKGRPNEGDAHCQWNQMNGDQSPGMRGVSADLSYKLEIPYWKFKFLSELQDANTENADIDRTTDIFCHRGRLCSRLAYSLRAVRH